MEKHSYCKKHDTYPLDDEPCWACIREHYQIGAILNPSDSIAAENQKNRKPCRVDKITPCVQHSDEDECGCDSCEECEVAITHKEKNEN